MDLVGMEFLKLVTLFGWIWLEALSCKGLPRKEAFSGEASDAILHLNS